MTKQEIIDYVMTTPSNPNKAVLEGMLDSITNAGGDDEPKRVLLYENDALDISTQGVSPIIFAEPKAFLNFPVWFDDTTVSIEIDGTTVTGIESASNSSNDGFGIANPADTTSVANGASVGFGCQRTLVTRSGNASDGTKKVVGACQFIMLDSTKFTAGTHSVKIYKEV